GLLACVTGILFQRYRTLELEGYGGLAKRFPRLAGVTLVAVVSLSAVPFTSGFSAMILTLMGAGKLHAGYAACGLAGLILSSWCLTRAMQQLFCGKFREPVIEHPAWSGGDCASRDAEGDLNLRELAATFPLAAALLFIGLVPQSFLEPTAAAVQRIAETLDREPITTHAATKMKKEI
ncbi:unnamed protein product, partial [marine sediment metagenome]